MTSSRLYAVVTCDVIESYAVVKVTADSSTQGRAGFKGQCAYQYAFGNYTCNFCIVRYTENVKISVVAFYPTDFTANFRILPPKVWVFWSLL